mgnify:CR=1 FL=1
MPNIFHIWHIAYFHKPNLVKNLSIPLNEEQWAIFDRMKKEAEKEAGGQINAAVLGRFLLFCSPTFRYALIRQYLELIETFIPPLLEAMAEEEE